MFEEEEEEKRERRGSNQEKEKKTGNSKDRGIEGQEKKGRKEEGKG